MPYALKTFFFPFFSSQSNFSSLKSSFPCRSKLLKFMTILSFNEAINEFRQNGRSMWQNFPIHFILNMNASTKLPFHIDRCGMNWKFLCFDSALPRNPALVGLPQGDIKGRVPPFVCLSPPPGGWSIGFIAAPQTKVHLPNHWLCTAFLSLHAPWLGLKTLPIVSCHRESMSFSTPEGGRTQE